jgi:hypothetical protein
MKKLLTLALGMTMIFATVAAVFGQGGITKEDTAEKKPGKGGKGGNRETTGPGSHEGR